MRLFRSLKLLRRCWLVASATVLLIAAGDGFSCWANAQSFGSSYSSIATKQCRIIGAAKGGDDSSVRVCPGKTGWQVLVSQDDLRETVSVGRNRILADKEPAAQTRFEPFSFAGNKVEWRLQNGRPFAIIQRWQLDDNADMDKNGRPKPKAMLVVTRLPPGPVCHVAYVDVAANPNANDLARKAADELAHDFKCGTDAVATIGASGRTTELAKKE